MTKIHSNQSISFLINGGEKESIKILKNPKTFNDFSQTIDDVS